MSIPETVLIYAGVPLAVIAVVAGIVYAGGNKTRTRRYRPGRPYDFAPVWFTSAAKPGTESDALALEQRVPQAALPAVASAPGVTGGASDRW